MLQVLVEFPLWEQVLLAQELFREQRELREFGRGCGYGARRKELFHLVRHADQRGALALHHVGVELRGTANGLAGVIDDEVQARVRVDQFLAEGLNAGGMPEVEAKNFKAVGPLGEVGLLGITLGGVAGEAGRDDQVGAGAEELESGLVANLYAAAGEQGDAAGEIGELGPLVEVEFGAGGAHLVIKVMHLGVFLLADVAVERFGRLAGVLFGVGGREVVGSGEDGLPAQGADPGFVENGGGAFDVGGAAFAFEGLQSGPARHGIGVEDLGDDAMEPLPFGSRKPFEQGAIGV